ncbi:nucleotidyltransferase [Flavobacterium sp. ZE23DGlu08]|uniref:nucleotidyltransferase domain-containing protein n=1 Tax=Flavobacterium sp. ZE23DGlu08 TaxID=3059026 RepID=UPI0026604218|nr:nucleotidyltransferase [Flavobacterium sp. ZE23DGlu08]WKL43729.1 nucleotidyltransferase [Flavobacterium sp. ZE23DGlu08]
MFGGFNTEISLTSNKKSKMTTSKDGIRERIRKYFRENHSEYNPKFYIQGSYKMKTGIRTKDDICDLDDGVYFFRTPDVTATTLQNWIWDAVNGYTVTSPEHRKKCIRNIFSGDYEIDIPVYYKVSGQEYKIAVKNNGWEDSDPKSLIDWFNENKDANGKIVKVIKELKAWCDYKRNKMPSGLAMTILAVNAKNNIVLNDRDDILLTDILREIKKTLAQKFECIVPVTPKDNLFADYDETRKTNFLNNLDSFLADAEAALKEQNHLKASKLWQKHLGNRFSDGEDKNEQSNSNSATTTGAALSKPWGK